MSLELESLSLLLSLLLLPPLSSLPPPLSRLLTASDEEVEVSLLLELEAESEPEERELLRSLLPCSDFPCEDLERVESLPRRYLSSLRLRASAE